MIKTNFIYNAVITRVIDGDTVDATVDLGFRIFTILRLRLHGIDTAELNDRDPALREHARQGKQFVENLTLNKQVTLETFRTDKFGRWLAVIYIDGQNVNQLLLEHGLAKPYE